MEYKTILYQVEESILTITLNRPDKLNAFSTEMRTEIMDALERADADDDVRAIILTGAGRGFCAGADLSGGSGSFDREKRGRVAPLKPNGEIDYSDDIVRDGAGRLTLRIFDCLKPVIAAVNGAAAGVGCTMLLPMDVRIASDNAKFGFVFSRRGIVPEGASSWFLPRLVGISQALEWTCSGRIFGAEEALRGGLVSRVVPPDQLLPTARAIAKDMTSQSSPVAVALIRQMMWKMLTADHPMEAHKIDSRGIYARGKSADTREGVAAFLEKRSAVFPDKVSRDMPDYFPWWRQRLYD